MSAFIPCKPVADRIDMVAFTNGEVTVQSVNRHTAEKWASDLESFVRNFGRQPTIPEAMFVLHRGIMW